MDFSDSLGELPLSRLCSSNRTSASCPSLPRYQAACVSILCGSARAVARITCAADSGGGTRERISLRPPDPHSPWHDAITQQSGRFTANQKLGIWPDNFRLARHPKAIRSLADRSELQRQLTLLQEAAGHGTAWHR